MPQKHPAPNVAVSVFTWVSFGDFTGSFTGELGPFVFACASDRPADGSQPAAAVSRTNKDAARTTDVTCVMEPTPSRERGTPSETAGHYTPAWVRRLLDR